MLESLIKPAQINGSAVSRETAIVRLPLHRIVDNPYQPRLDYAPESLQDLAEGIRSLKDQLRDTLGLQQIPIARLVWLNDEPQPLSIAEYAKLGRGDQFSLFEKLGVQLHFGHRRLRAFRLLAETDPDYAHMPIRIAYADEYNMWRHAATENARRVGINPIERARSIQAAMTDFGLAIDEAAEPYGYSRSAAANSVRLLKLPLAIQKAVSAGELTEKHARTLLRLADAPHLLADLYERSVKNEWSTRLLDDNITNTITMLRPMPDGPVEEEYTEWGNKRTRVVQPLWPLDFGPDTPGWESLSADLRFNAKGGACAGCQYRVQFHGDAYPRCTLQSCHDAKYRLWRDHQVAQQQSALLAKAKTVYVEPTPEPAEPPAWERPKNADASMTVAEVAALIRQALAERNDCPEFEAYAAARWSIFLANNYGKWPLIDITRQAIKEVQRKPGHVDAYVWLSAYVDDKGRTWCDLDDNQVYHANSPCFQAFTKAHPALTKDKAKAELMAALTRLQSDSTEPDWANGWTDDDDEEYESIVWDVEDGDDWGGDRRSFYDDGTPQVHRITRPLVALRLLTETEDETVQGYLRDHYELLIAQVHPAPAAAHSPVPSPQSAIPVDKMHGDLSATRSVTTGVSWFGDYNAPAKYLESGLCSAERCECFVLAYNHHPSAKNVRPDAEAAPNMCYGCTSSARMAARKREAEKLANPDGLTKKQAAKAQAKADRARIEDAFDELGPANLWTNVAFLRAAFSAMNNTLNGNLKIDLDGGSVEDLQRAVYLAAAYHACDTHIYELGDYDVETTRVDTFLGKLRTPNQPGPGDSQRTGWEAGWTEEDDAEWAKLVSVPFADWPQKCRRPCVILRGLEHAQGKETRGALWRWYNELESRGY